MPLLPALYPTHSMKDLYAHEVMSEKSWQPIFDIRQRTPWVQIVAFDLFKQLTAMRLALVQLPSFDTICLPLDRQTRVAFGDLLMLCDAIEYVMVEYGQLAVVHGGPDEKGTLWIKFYKMSIVSRKRHSSLEYIVWIDSRAPSPLTPLEMYNIFTRRPVEKPTPLVPEVEAVYVGRV